MKNQSLPGYWLVTSKPFPEIRVEVWAESRAKAIVDQWRKAREAGYRVKWTDFRAVRSTGLEGK